MLSKRVLKTLFFTLFILVMNTVYAQQEKTITGKVTDEKGIPVENASVVAKGAKEGVKTNAAGSFSITVPSTVTTLEISSVGHTTKTVVITGKSVVDIQLPVLIGSLDSVVVVGYTTQKRKDFNGAVSSVKGDAIKNLPTTNVAEALQGRMAGVEVIKESAEPGVNNAKITIRGPSSLNQPDPLYVIDGVIQKNNGGANINPQDIASVDVLKDASAAAIYGAAAAGGVIIITTKKGQGGTKPVLNFNARYGVTTPRVYTLLDKPDFIKYKTLTGDQFYSNPANTDPLPDYDWVDALYSNGSEENYSLSLSGKSPGVDYFISGVYNKQKGIFLDNDSKFAAVRANMDVKISDKVKIGEQIYIWKRSTTPVKTPIVITPFRTVPTGQAYSGNPDFPWGDFPNGYQGVNVMAQIKTASFDFPEYTFTGNTYLEAKLPPKYLTFKATFGYTYQGYENNIFRDVYNTSITPNTINSLYRANGKYEQLLNAFILAYDHTYGGIHTINLLAGYEQYQNFTSSLYTSATAVGGNSYTYIKTSGSALDLGGAYDPTGLVQSVFGRVNYDLDKKLVATFTIRNDANYTVFGPANQSGTFPSASIGYRISEERFFQEALPKINYLKIRASYGNLGNSNIPTFRYLTSYANIGYQRFSNGGGNSYAGWTQEQIANEHLKWETLTEANVGIDGELFNGKLFFSVDWYNKRTKDMLYKVPVPPSSGVPHEYAPDGTELPQSMLANVGEVQNSGVDILVGYKSKAKELNYTLTFTGSFNKNKVTKLDGIYDKPLINAAANSNYPGTGNSIWVNQPLTYTAVGLPFGQFYGYKVLGIFKTDEEAEQYKGLMDNPLLGAGDLHFADLNNDGHITDADKTVIGNPYPKFTFGIAANFNWKNFDLSLLFNGALGVDIYNGVSPYTMSTYDGGNVTDKVFETSLFNGNGVTDYPRIGVFDGLDFVDKNQNYTRASDWFVENGNYIKLKNLQLGYTLPSSMISKFKLKGARFFLMGNNIFQITSYSGIDPEIGGDINTRGVDRLARYPNARIFSAGIDLTL